MKQFQRGNTSCERRKDGQHCEADIVVYARCDLLWLSRRTSTTEAHDCKMLSSMGGQLSVVTT
jgi:hypothetical protein